MNSHRVKLSLQKFAAALTARGFSAASVYTVGPRECRFIECLTPHQRSFLIYVPEKYEMRLDGTCRIAKLIRSNSSSDAALGEEEGREFKTVKLLKKAMGGNTAIHLVTFTAQGLHLFQGDKVTIYESRCGEEKGGRAEAMKQESKYVTLEKEAKNLFIKLGLDTPEVTPQLMKRMKTVNPQSNASKSAKRKFIEVVFVDAGGDSIDSVSAFSALPTTIPSSLPPPSEACDLTVHIGRTMVCFSLNNFFTLLPSGDGAEQEIIKMYAAMDGAIKETRHRLLKELTTTFEQLHHRLKAKLEAIDRDEAKLQGQIARFTAIFDKARGVQNGSGKSSKTPRAWRDDVTKNTKEVLARTRASILEMNVRAAHLRDAANNMLTGYLVAMSKMLPVVSSDSVSPPDDTVGKD